MDKRWAELCLPNDIIQSANIVWDYMLLHHQLKKSDLILIFGNHDLRTARYGARLFLDGWADKLMISGKEGNYTRGKWSSPEAEIFRNIAEEMGVPREKIILEKSATNTGENVSFSKVLLDDLQLKISSAIVVQMPMMERRTYATFMKQWANVESLNHLIISSPPMSLIEFPTEEVGDIKHTVNLLVECMDRIKVYPAKGFQIPQEIPKNVVLAHRRLKNWCDED